MFTVHSCYSDPIGTINENILNKKISLNNNTIIILCTILIILHIVYY